MGNKQSICISKAVVTNKIIIGTISIEIIIKLVLAITPMLFFATITVAIRKMSIKNRIFKLVKYIMLKQFAIWFNIKAADRMKNPIKPMQTMYFSTLPARNSDMSIISKLANLLNNLQIINVKSIAIALITMVCIQEAEAVSVMISLAEPSRTWLIITTKISAIASLTQIFL